MHPSPIGAYGVSNRAAQRGQLVRRPFVSGPSPSIGAGHTSTEGTTTMAPHFFVFLGLALGLALGSTAFALETTDTHAIVHHLSVRS